MDNTVSVMADKIARSETITQEEVARLAGIERSQLSRALRGQRRLSADAIYRANDALSALLAADAAAAEAREAVLAERGYGEARAS